MMFKKKIIQAAATMATLSFLVWPAWAEKAEQPEPAEKTEAAEKAEPAAKKVDPDKKVAVVNDTVITQGDLSQEMGPVQQRMAMQGQAPDDAQMEEVQQKVLQNMIDRELLYQESRKQGFTAEDDAVKAQMETFKSRFPDEAQFEEALSRLNLTEDIIRKQIEEQLSIQKLVDEKILPTISIPEEELKTYYEENTDFFKEPEQVHARHILIKVEPDADEAAKEEARKKLEEVRKKLEEGGDFAELAKEYSEGPSNVKGGDLGYFGRGQMVKPFDETAFATDKGEVSDIVETRFGYHLIKVEDKKAASTTAYEDVKEKIENHLKQQKVQEALAKYLEDLKKDAKVEVYL